MILGTLILVVILEAPLQQPFSLARKGIRETTGRLRPQIRAADALGVTVIAVSSIAMEQLPSGSAACHHERCGSSVTRRPGFLHRSIEVKV